MDSPLKQIWIEKINSYRGDWLSPKELAFILGLSVDQIYYSFKKNSLHFQRSSKGKQSNIMIAKSEAIFYINNYL